MKVSQLLNEIRYGKDVVEKTTEKDIILNNLNEEGQLVVSQLLKDRCSALSEGSLEVVETLEKISSKLSDVEGRVFDGKQITKAYARMKYDSIKSDCKKLNESLKDKKTYKSFDSKELAKAIAVIPYGVKKLFNEDLNVKFDNSLLNNFIVEQMSFIEKVID